MKHSLGKSQFTSDGYEFICFPDACLLHKSHRLEHILFVGADGGEYRIRLVHGDNKQAIELNRKQVRALAKHLNHWLRNHNFQDNVEQDLEKRQTYGIVKMPKK